MPWRNRYITTRRHPMAIGCYLMTLLMGVFFLTGLFDSAALNDAIGAGWQVAWQLLMVLGGAVALAGVACPQSHLEDALSLESAGASACGLGLVVYTLALVLAFGWSTPVVLVLGALAGGALWRAPQARRDRRKVAALALALERGWTPR